MYSFFYIIGIISGKNLENTKMPKSASDLPKISKSVNIGSTPKGLCILDKLLGMTFSASVYEKEKESDRIRP